MGNKENIYGNTPGNIVNGGFAALQGDRIYYCNYSPIDDNPSGELYSIKTNGTDRQIVDTVSDEDYARLQVLDKILREYDWIESWDFRDDGTNTRQPGINELVKVRIGSGSVFEIKYGLVGVYGNIVVPCLYQDIGYLQRGVAIVRLWRGSDMVYGVINKNGELIIPCEYNRIDINSDNIMAVTISYGLSRQFSYRYFDFNGNEIVP